MMLMVALQKNIIYNKNVLQKYVTWISAKTIEFIWFTPKMQNIKFLNFSLFSFFLTEFWRTQQYDDNKFIMFSTMFMHLKIHKIYFWKKLCTYFCCFSRPGTFSAVCTNLSNAETINKDTIVHFNLFI